MSLVLRDIPEDELKKLRFVLKLWIVTNDTSNNCLRWNRDQTILIVNLHELMVMFLKSASNIFMCKTVENFLWLMYKHAFTTRTPSDVLEESERNEIAPECMLFVHPQFIGSNSDMFEGCLSNSAVRVHEIAQKGSCTLPSKMHFTVRENIDELNEARTKALSVMAYLRLQLRKAMREQESVLIDIPLPFVDYQVMDVPDYFKTKEIEGYYGPVCVSELKRCLGDLLPIPCNDLANAEYENTTDVMQEVEVPVDNGSMDNDTFYILQEPSAITTEAPTNLQFNDLRELYESANAWTDTDGYLFECHEIYEINDDMNGGEDVIIEVVKEDDENVVESLDSALPTESTKNFSKMDDEIYETYGEADDEMDVKIEVVKAGDENAVESSDSVLPTKSTVNVGKIDHEMYESDEEVEVKIESVKECDKNGMESSNSALPTQSTEKVTQMDEYMPEYLTKSVQACLPAIDFD